jgi:heme exporter protein D
VHDPEKLVLDLDRGWIPAFGQDHAQKEQRMNLGPHADFIVAAYAVTVFVVAALLAWVLLDYSAQRRILGDLEERGINRRSQRGAGR